MIDAVLRAHLSGGVSIIVGTVAPDGAPVASKGYGVQPIADDVVHVWLDATESHLIACVRGSGRLAITSGNVFTYQSVQLKGAVQTVASATADEHEMAVELTRRFNERIAQLQNLPAALFDRRAPSEFVTCTVAVDSIFDQSPGPMAGARLVGGAP